MTDNTPAQPDPAETFAAAKSRRAPASRKPGFWKFGPPPEGTGPPPIPPRAAKTEPDPAAKPEPEPEPAAKAEPEPGAEDTDTGPQIDAEPPEPATVAEDTPPAFVDAFGPHQQADDDGGFTPEEYDALARSYERADGDTGDSDDEPEPASRREARYRTQLRDTEVRLRAAADEICRQADELDAMRRVEAVRLASARLADPEADLFRDSHVEAVLADDGTVDPDRVNELADSIIASHPHYAAPRPTVDPNRLQSGAARADEVEPTSWQRAFAPRPQ